MQFILSILITDSMISTIKCFFAKVSVNPIETWLLIQTNCNMVDKVTKLYLIKSTAT